MNYGSVLIKFMAYCRQQLNIKLPIPLTETRFYLLWEIEEFERLNGNGIQVSELSHKLHMSRPAATRLTNELEELGLLIKIRNKIDRRNTYLCLTEGGQVLLRDMVTIADNFAAKHLHGLSAKEKSDLENLINKVSSEANKF